MPKRTDIQSILIICVAAALLSAPLAAEAKEREPLVTKTKIEAVAAKCGAKVTVSYVPDIDDESNAVQKGNTLIVGVQRNNSPEAIACMKDYLPTVVTMLVGREKGVPPLNQAIIDEVLRQCDWRKEDGIVGLIGDDELQFQPNSSAEYERVQCVLEGVRRYSPKMGFVGNEAYTSEKEQK
jgi:hypothetical protein